MRSAGGAGKAATVALLLFVALATLGPLIPLAGALTDHAPILIDGDSSWTASNGVNGGLGTPASPYVIERWNISATTASSIEIRNTKSYFIVRNVTVHGGDTEHPGIALKNVSHGALEGVLSYDNAQGLLVTRSQEVSVRASRVLSNGVAGYTGGGIDISQSSSVSLIGNYLDLDAFGISFSQGTDLSVLDNQIVRSSPNRYGVGITLTGVVRATLKGNNLSWDNTGLYVSSSNDLEVLDNLFSNEGTGLSVYSSGNVMLLGNIFRDLYYVGALFSASNNVTATGNDVARASTGIRIDASTNATLGSNALHQDSSGLVLTRISGPGVIVTSNQLNNNTGTALTVSMSTGVLLEDNTLEGNYVGLVIEGSDHVTALRNNIRDSDYLGAHLSTSTNVTLRGNVFSGDGLLLTGSQFAGPPDQLDTHTITTDNLVNGLPLRYYARCNNAVLDGLPTGELIMTDCRDVRVSGLRIFGSDYAMELLGLHNATFEGNSIENNTYGIFSFFGDNLTFTRNAISGSSIYGIYMQSPRGLSLRDNGLQNNVIGIMLNAGWSGTPADTGSVLQGNVLLRNGMGLRLSYVAGVTVLANTIRGNQAGVAVEHSHGLLLYHNNFLQNAVQQSVDSVTDVLWDAGYPSGGNYWSDYGGVDHCSGPAQDVCPDPDGIGDSPYQGLDGYPLMLPFGLATLLPVPIFSASPSEPILGQPVTFDASASFSPGGSIASYHWDLGDGGDATGVRVSHLYLGAGTYTVSLTVIDDAGLRNSTGRSLTIRMLPLTVSIRATATAGRAPLPVSFASDVGGGYSLQPYRYAWTFGDGWDSSEAHPNHVYANAGSYVATLEVTDALGSMASASLEVAVSDPPLGLLALADPPFGPAPLKVTFRTLVVGGTGHYGLTWEFGDGASEPSATPIHTYVNPGNYTASVRVVDDDGQVATSEVEVIVIPASGPTSPGPLVATAGADIVGRLTVDFTAGAAGGVAPYAFLWDFGDGSSSALQGPTHTYGKAGNYTVSLQVLDGSGHTASRLLHVNLRTSGPRPVGDEIMAAAFTPPAVALGLVGGLALGGTAIVAHRRRRNS